MTESPEREFTCEWCDEVFSRPPRRGPNPRYCSASHRQRAYEARQTVQYAASQLKSVELSSAFAAHVKASELAASKVTSAFAAQMKASQVKAITMSGLLHAQVKVSQLNVVKVRDAFADQFKVFGNVSTSLAPQLKLLEDVNKSWAPRLSVFENVTTSRALQLRLLEDVNRSLVTQLKVLHDATNSIAAQRLTVDLAKSLRPHLQVLDDATKSFSSRVHALTAGAELRLAAFESVLSEQRRAVASIGALASQMRGASNAPRFRDLVESLENVVVLEEQLSTLDLDSLDEVATEAPDTEADADALATRHEVVVLALGLLIQLTVLQQSALHIIVAVLKGAAQTGLFAMEGIGALELDQEHPAFHGVVVTLTVAAAIAYIVALRSQRRE